MPEINLRHEIATDEDTYWPKIVFDEAFNRAMYLDHMKFPGWKILSQEDSETQIKRRVQVDPPLGNYPAPVKKVIGDRLSYIEDGVFDRKTKRYAFKVIPSTLAEKTHVSGELWCETLGEKKIARMCRISVEVKVFMVGSVIENLIVADLRASYDRGTSFTNTYIAEHGL